MINPTLSNKDRLAVAAIPAMLAGAIALAYVGEANGQADALYNIAQAQGRGSPITCERGYQSVGSGRTGGAYLTGTNLTTEGMTYWIDGRPALWGTGRKLQLIANECRGESNGRTG